MKKESGHLLTPNEALMFFDELPGEPDPPPSSRSWLWTFAVFAVPVVLIALVRMREG
jgi:hypothetical protein